MFDATFHIGDIIALVTVGAAAYTRVSGTLRAIERFMEESREDRLSIHRRMDLVEHQIRVLRKQEK
jgi:hypothetical protein